LPFAQKKLGENVDEINPRGQFHHRFMQKDPVPNRINLLGAYLDA
jgi:hypothetical protein